MPLVNEVVIPLGRKDRFNASEPADDAQFGKFVLDPEPARLIPGLYPGIKVPAAPRNDIATIFLTGIPGLNQPRNVVPSEMIRLNMGIPPTRNPSPLGVLGGDNAGFPNGRRLADDSTDVELRALAGGTPFTPDFNIAPNNKLGDGVNTNDTPFLDQFPYVGTPTRGTPATRTTSVAAPRLRSEPPAGGARTSGPLLTGGARSRPGLGILAAVVAVALLAGLLVGRFLI